MELHRYAIVVLVIHITLFCSQTVLFLSRRSDQSRKNMLKLIGLFLIHNLMTGFLPDHIFDFNLGLKELITYLSGLTLAMMYLKYFVKDLGLRMISKHLWFAMCVLIIAVLIFSVIGFVILSQTEGFPRMLLVIFPLLISGFFIVYALQHTITELSQRKNLLYDREIVRVGFCATVVLACAPVLIYIGRLEIIITMLITVCLLLSYGAYLKRYMRIAEEEHDALHVHGFYSEIHLSDLQVTLSKMQFKVAIMMLQNMDFPQIAKQLVVSDGTARKHGANIYKILNCVDRKEFLERFGYLRAEIQQTAGI